VTTTHLTLSPLYLFPPPADLQALHSFPTRRSSDLKYPDGRVIAFAGLHPSPNLNGVPAGAVKNPLNGNVAEPNGTMIIDITNPRSEEHTSELQSLRHLVCRLLLEKKNSRLDA